eukprot:gnl/MRDRNA2_/MRDRNA2_86433_c0_seq1.p1 gnl/MRDRNA2_/MRDRNA2_86433_c0~~gnl/MRDRNA2_/MRDRNA2_86433_c0_seq1.p1  ORF type:complete len:221 (+),score=33.07 gnl/MRDRNA2_/MRDRNA2_86433_c0_seq1:66-665(+)
MSPDHLTNWLVQRIWIHFMWVVAWVLLEAYEEWQNEEARARITRVPGHAPVPATIGQMSVSNQLTQTDNLDAIDVHVDDSDASSLASDADAFNAQMQMQDAFNAQMRMQSWMVATSPASSRNGLWQLASSEELQEMERWNLQLLRIDGELWSNAIGEIYRLQCLRSNQYMQGRRLSLSDDAGNLLLTGHGGISQFRRIV